MNSQPVHDIYGSSTDPLLSEVLAYLSPTLDLAEGMPMGHALRTCILSLRLARRVCLSEAEINDLFFAALLKYIGGAKRRAKVFDLLTLESKQAQLFLRNRPWDDSRWNHLFMLLRQSRSMPDSLHTMQRILRGALHKDRIARELNRSCGEEGSVVAHALGLPKRTSETILHQEESWSSTRGAAGRRYGEIPLLSRVLDIAEMLEVIGTTEGFDYAIRRLHKRSMNRFDPGLVAAATLLHEQGRLWSDMEPDQLVTTALRLGPQNSLLRATPAVLDLLCLSFARVIDARTHFTHRHSERVARIAQSIGMSLGISEYQMEILHRAALLHDLGNLMQPAHILEKRDKLTEDERALCEQHTLQARNLLRDIPGFAEVAEVIAGHHERLDGSGYPFHRKGDEISLLSRILGVAEVFDALASDRPYRSRMSPMAVYTLLKENTGAFDARCVRALYVTGALHAAA